LELFKVAADFDDDIQRNPKNNTLFAQLLKSLTKKDSLRPLTKEAVARVIEYGSRMAEDCLKVSTHVRRLEDLLREADHYSLLEGRSVIEQTDIEKTIEQQILRASRIKEQQFENITRGILLIDTTGSQVGQINGLAYLRLGGFAFGHPVRITARAGLGKGELIDIEREVKLGGPIHSKGVLILTGYLNGRFAKKEPLSLSASLVFEQSYGGVEGDSASVAEACALLSAIADIPVTQSMAVTGSINQHGHIQPIGGVNEKIEGFFDICQERELAPGQGCVIPKANIETLMLKEDIVEAAKKGLFHIYAVETIDQAMEILTGIEAGQRDEAGNFPKNSINGKVEAALKAFAKKASSGKLQRKKLDKA
jgi:predicted ATP-dependent protease